MTDDKIRDLAVDYVARHNADSGQIFTSPACQIHEGPEGFKSVQVWVGIPLEELSEERAAALDSEFDAIDSEE